MVAGDDGVSAGELACVSQLSIQIALSRNNKPWALSVTK